MCQKELLSQHMTQHTDKDLKHKMLQMQPDRQDTVHFGEACSCKNPDRFEPNVS